MIGASVLGSLRALRVPHSADLDPSCRAKGAWLPRLTPKTSTPPRGDLKYMFTSIDHVGVAVADLDAAIRFYEDTFGMEKVHEEVNEDQGVREAMMRVGKTDSFVQLLAPLRPDSPIGKFLENSGPGLQQVAYRVTDIRATAQSLRDRGVTHPLRRTAPRNRWRPHQLHSPQGRRRGTRRTRPASPVGSGNRDHPATEADVQHIRDAILSGNATPEDFANIEIPDHYLGARPAQGGRRDVRGAQHQRPRPA